MSDHSVFILKRETNIVILNVKGDDIIVFVSSVIGIAKSERLLDRHLSNKGS